MRTPHELQEDLGRLFTEHGRLAEGHGEIVDETGDCPICDGAVQLAAAIEELARIRQEQEDDRYDLGVIIGEVSSVYDELTGGKFSKPNTRADYIIEAANRVRDQYIEDAEEPLRDRIRELENGGVPDGLRG